MDPGIFRLKIKPEPKKASNSRKKRPNSQNSFCFSATSPIFVTLVITQERELSSAGSEHLPYKQRVGGSNPSAPTLKSRKS